jgi:SAM-dependent methyltransferase
MFFPERIKSIKSEDYVLEIGPGGTPHPRSDILLEKVFGSPSEEEAQRGFSPALKTDKNTIYYDGGKFPFKDKEFDYIICSHVLEHIEDVDSFIAEINRVGNAGYFEYPSIYYEYIYNFPEHTTLIKKRNDKIVWMLKKDAGLSNFKPVNKFFYETLKKNYTSMINEFKDYFFEGFEWSKSISQSRTDKIEDLVFDDINLAVWEEVRPPKKMEQSGFVQRLKELIKFRRVS